MVSAKSRPLYLGTKSSRFPLQCAPEDFDWFLSVFWLFFPNIFFLNFPVLGIALQPQGDYIELHQKRHGRRPDHEERKRKRQAREVHKTSKQAQNVSRG